MVNMNLSKPEHRPLILPVHARVFGYTDSGVAAANSIFRAAFPRFLLHGLVSVAMAIALAACGSSSPDSTPASNPSPSPPPVPGVGDIVISGRINPVNHSAASLTPTSAIPDHLTATIQEVAVSADDSNYETVVTGPVQVSLDETSPPPSIGQKGGLAVGPYKTLRLSMNSLDWDVQWGFTNPSPCDGATTGSATGTLDLSTTPVLYFKTADLGGNTLEYYRATPPLTGYPGDIKHPLILPAPIEIVKDKATTVDLLFDAYRSLGCNRVSIFTRSDNGDVTPQLELEGPATSLYDSGLMTVDARRDQIAVLNRFTSSVAFFDGATTGGNINPGRILRGPSTALNDPSGVAFYCPKLNPTDTACDPNITATDQYVVANRNNDSITTYAAIAANNTAPVRSIFGYLTQLDQPSDVSVSLDPSGDPAKDEMAVTNSGNNSITTYARLDFGNSTPIRVIAGSNTGLANPCGIAVDNQNRMLYITNKDNDSITVYHTNDSGNIAPYATLAGSNTGLSSPCGIDIDGTNNEVIVTNSGNDSILTFSNSAFGAGYNDVAPIRTISGPATQIHQPIGSIVAGNQLWVTHKGEQAAMALPPMITPVSSVESSSTPRLDGVYNIVINGVDFRGGVNGRGIRIPEFFSDRGTAHFDSQASPWPSFTYNVDTESRRRVLAPGCNAPNYQTRSGFYGVGADHHFYAATEDHQGIIDGAFVSDGRDFTSTFYSGKEIFVVYGTKATSTTVPYLTSNGTDTGAANKYTYIGYLTNLLPYGDPITAKTPDSLNNKLEAGVLSTDTDYFLTLEINYNQVRGKSPMGFVNEPLIQRPFQYLNFAVTQPHPYLSHAGGFFENQDYGMAGISSANSDLLLLMRDITDKAANNCSQAFGVGFGITRQPAGTYTMEDFKGTYYVSAFGDKFISATSRPKYSTISGTITFDGIGGVISNLVENTEGELTSLTDPMTYSVSPTIKNFTAAPDDTLLLVNEKTGVPFAEAHIARDGKTLFMLSPTKAPGTPVAENIGNDVRLLGYAVLQEP